MKKTKYWYQNNYNAVNTPAGGELPNEGRKHMTVPNQSMTVREMIIRFASGLPISGGRRADLFASDELTPDVEKMDLIERERYYDELVEKRKAATDRVTKARLQKEKEKVEKIVAERITKAKEEQDRKEFEEFRKSRGNVQ